MLNVKIITAILAIVIVAIIVVSVVGMTSMSNYSQPEMDPDEHIQKLDIYILDRIFNGPQTKAQIEELHTCQKLQFYGNLLAAENDLRYEDGPYGDRIEPESDEQTKITDEFIKLSTSNRGVYDELNCSETHDDEWGTDEFYEFQSRQLRSNYYFD